MSFALTELADRIAVRGEFAGACEYYEQAIAVVTEVGAIEDVIRMRSLQAQLCWLLGDHRASAAAMEAAQRCAERVTWPDALAELAIAKAKLARWAGNAAEAHQQLGVATTLLGDEADRAIFQGLVHDILGYLADDPGQARAHRAAACQAATEAGHAPLTAQVLVGVADLALRRDQYEQAARLLAASVGVRGLPDRSNPDAARIEQAARLRLGDAKLAQAEREGAQASWRQLADATLAC
jgi:tetratricopeptide (TPR) repeat protein